MPTSKPHFPRLARTATLIIFERVTRAAINLGLLVLIARHLGKTEFGVYSYLLAFGGFFLPLVSLGMDSIASRVLAERPTDRGLILGSMLFAKLAGGFFALLLCWVSLFVFEGRDSSRPWLILPIGLGLFFQAMETFEYHFQSLSDQKLTTWVRILCVMIGAGMRIGLFLMKAPLVAFLWVFAIESACVGIGFFLVYRLSQGPQLKFLWRESRGLILTSWPLAISSVAILIYMRIDQVMLEKISGPSSLGAYAVAVKVSESWYLLPVAVGTAALPIFVLTLRRSMNDFLHSCQRLFDTMTVLALLAGFALTWLGPHLLTLIFGPAYSEASSILVISGWTGLFVCWGVIRGAALNAKGITHFQLAATLTGALVNVILNLFLIPRWGALGAAWATLVAQFFSSHFSGWFYRPARFTAFMQGRSLFPLHLWKGVTSLSRLPLGKSI